MVNMIDQTDVIVAGGGPAGLVAAIAARRKGFEVAVFEGVAAPAIDKCCGEGLMPDAIGALRELGIVLPPSAGVPFPGIRLLDGDTTAEAFFPQQPGIGVRRTELHALLAEHARQAGVSLFWGTPVRGLALSGVRVGDQVVRSRWIIAADGSQSTLRRAAGLDQPGRTYPRRFGSRRHFRIEPWTDLVEVHWAHGAQAYVTPVAKDEIGVAIICSDPLLRYQDLLPLFPALAGRLDKAVATSSLRGAMTASHRLARVTGANLALIGDASGSVDALTGLGLSLAFQQAIALGDALAEDDLPAYAAAHRRISKMPRVMETLMLSMDRRDGFRRRAMRALAAEPAHFSRLLAMHAGALPPFSFALRAPFSLGWKFFTA
jgi:flavin-dependent dehydrogenase